MRARCTFTPSSISALLPVKTCNCQGWYCQYGSYGLRYLSLQYAFSASSPYSYGSAAIWCGYIVPYCRCSIVSLA